MTSILVDRGSPAHLELRASGWKEDIHGPRPNTVWINSPGRYRIELSYVAPCPSSFDVLVCKANQRHFQWTDHNTRTITWFQHEIGMKGDNSEEACLRYFMTLVDLSETSQPRPQCMRLDIFDTDECERVFHASQNTAVDGE